MSRSRTYASGGDNTYQPGQIVVACAVGRGAWISKDYGESYSKLPLGDITATDVILRDGGRLVVIVAGGRAYLSKDYGEIFAEVKGIANPMLLYADITDDGDTLAYVIGSNIRVRRLSVGTSSSYFTRYGAMGVRMSRDGKYIIAPNSSYNTVAISANGGKSWGDISLSGKDDQGFRGVSLSRDGRTALLGKGFGSTPPTRRAGGSTYSGWSIWWVHVRTHGTAVSDDGTIQYIYSSQGLYKSTNSGVSFTKINLPSSANIPARGALGFGVSGDGQAVYLTDDNHIYRSLDGGASWTIQSKPVSGELNLIATNSNQQ